LTAESFSAIGSVFSLLGPFGHRSMLIVIEGRMDQAWEPSNESDSFLGFGAGNVFEVFSREQSG
jgi:hypothetical protein